MAKLLLPWLFALCILAGLTWIAASDWRPYPQSLNRRNLTTWATVWMVWLLTAVAAVATLIALAIITFFRQRATQLDEEAAAAAAGQGVVTTAVAASHNIPATQSQPQLTGQAGDNNLARELNAQDFQRQQLGQPVNDQWGVQRNQAWGSSDVAEERGKVQDSYVVGNNQAAPVAAPAGNSVIFVRERLRGLEVYHQTWLDRVLFYLACAFLFTLAAAFVWAIHRSFPGGHDGVIAGWAFALGMWLVGIIITYLTRLGVDAIALQKPQDLPAPAVGQGAPVVGQAQAYQGQAAGYPAAAQPVGYDLQARIRQLIPYKLSNKLANDVEEYVFYLLAFTSGIAWTFALNRTLRTHSHGWNTWMLTTWIATAFAAILAMSISACVHRSRRMAANKTTHQQNQGIDVEAQAAERDPANPYTFRPIARQNAAGANGAVVAPESPYARGGCRLCTFETLRFTEAVLWFAAATSVGFSAWLTFETRSAFPAVWVVALYAVLVSIVGGIWLWIAQSRLAEFRVRPLDQWNSQVPRWSYLRSLEAREHSGRVFKLAVGIAIGIAWHDFFVRLAQKVSSYNEDSLWVWAGIITFIALGVTMIVATMSRYEHRQQAQMDKITTKDGNADLNLHFGDQNNVFVYPRERTGNEAHAMGYPNYQKDPNVVQPTNMGGYGQQPMYQDTRQQAFV